MARYVDIDKPVYVRYIDEHSGEVVTSKHAIAEILQDTVGLFPVEDDVTKVIRCKDCKHYNAGFECLKEGYGIEYPPDYYCADGKRRE